MANHLKMATVQAILTLRERGWSYRRIARELGVHRETVSHHVRWAEGQAKPANPPPGSETPKPANRPPGHSGPPSLCEPFREVILAQLELGLSAKRVHQDLVAEHGFAGGYDSVKRFVRRLGQGGALPLRRMECEPGQEAQVDFGTGASILQADGKRKRPHVFRIVLSHSRKGYSEAVHRQRTEDFIRVLENAFWHFGGVPQVVVIDNLKAAVTNPDWFDPEINPKVQSFCQHYGFVIRPTRPYTPRHKGKVERGIGYVKGNALKGRTFSSLQEENRHLLDWEASVADTRIHGTTRKQVGKVFREVERPALQPLRAERFPCFHEAERSVHRDGHVEVDKSYYSVPPEYLGRRLWVRWDARVVRIFNRQMQQVALHVKREPGRFSTQGRHIASKKFSCVERGAAELLTKTRLIGPQTGRWAEAMLQQRGIQGVRVLVGLLHLARRHREEGIEKACEIAWRHGAFRLRAIRQLIQRQGLEPDPSTFIQAHPIIRDLSDYGQLIQAKGPGG